MRGDSIRDLYAKSLALLGLGVLAGAGALVDYWPRLSVVMPAPGVTQSGEQLALALPVPALEPPVLRTPVVERRVPEPEPVPVVPVYPSLALDRSIGLTGGEAVSLGVPPRQPLPAVAVLASSRGEEVLLSRPAEFTATTVARLAAPVMPVAENDGDGWAGPFKRTGTSIAKTSVKTGAAIVSAFGRLSSAFRRVLPD